MDYTALRAEGIGHLERMAGEPWSDFNSHDPGITILEQLAYVLSDFAYRIGHEVPDLLAEGGASPHRSLYRAEDILTTHPVTSTDLRKAVLDVDGVKNAWVEAAVGDGLALHYHPGREELSLEAEPPATEPVALVGLHRVLVEAVEGGSSTGLRARVAQRLYAKRPLGEDFALIKVLDSQYIQVNAVIEIGAVESAEAVLLDILSVLADHISPGVCFTTFDRMADGRGIDQVLDGPRLKSGHLGPEALPSDQRRTTLRTSDLVHAIMSVSGVRAITRIEVAAGGEPDPWSIDLDPATAPRLDVRTAAAIGGSGAAGQRRGSKIVLQSGGLAATIGIDDVRDTFNARQAAKQRTNRPGTADSDAIGSAFPMPAGRDRSVGTYYSLQHHLPALFGVAEMGLPDAAPSVRKAQAKQLKAYLLLFDQLLANGFTQLAHVRDLFSFYGGSTPTYFAEPIEDGRLGLEDVRTPAHREHLAQIIEPDADAGGATGASSGRKSRFLNHLLARFAEQFSKYSLVASGAAALSSEPAEAKLVKDKQAFLQRYPRISSARGTGADDLSPPGPSNESGLAERIRLKLGLSADEGEEFVLVEHLSLRPIENDRQQAIPILTASPHRDPYSLQLSFVFVGTEGRMNADGFRRFVEQTVRDETPAHLTPYVHWLERDDWDAFRAAHDDWLDRRRAYLLRALDLPVERGGE